MGVWSVFSSLVWVLRRKGGITHIADETPLEGRDLAYTHFGVQMLFWIGLEVGLPARVLRASLHRFVTSVSIPKPTAFWPTCLWCA
jgi:hypothetical protein